MFDMGGLQGKAVSRAARPFFTLGHYREGSTMAAKFNWEDLFNLD
jgi:hypothetical protein